MAFERNRLKRFIAEKPALANVPIIVVAGKPLSAREALDHLERNVNVPQITATLHPSVETDLWILAEEHYRRILSVTSPPRPKIRWIQVGGELTFEQALEQIQLKTDVGALLVNSYATLVNHVKRRLQEYG